MKTAENPHLSRVSVSVCLYLLILSPCVASSCRRLSEQPHTSTNSHLLPFQSVKTFVTAAAAPPLCAEGHLSVDACVRVCAHIGVYERLSWVTIGLKQ